MRKSREKSREQNDQRLTIYLPDGAVSGRVLTFRETGLVAHVEQPVPPEGRFRFTLHLSGTVISGEIARISQEDEICRLQYVALAPADHAHLEPWIEPDD